ncbi:hypothetical protein [Prosthecobacter sp.]|uniref:hypothetical protein n=1 Tax=Prosthecobacter sp. TaxID=1965333 RepID=UPI003784E29D
MGTLFDEREIFGLSQRPPFLQSVHGQQFPEQGTDAHAGVKIALTADFARAGSIITMLRMIERQIHDLCKRQATGGRGGELFSQNLGKGRHSMHGKELARIVKGG